MDIDETFAACQALHDHVPQIIEEETAFIEYYRADLIVGDIPPLCFEIAARVNIPSVAISNFTWSSIYRAYIKALPGFLPLIDEMESFYRKATLALALPYPCGMEVFPNQRPIPWIARMSSLTKKEARVKFGLPDSAIIVLLSFGGLGLKRVPWEGLKQNPEFFFVVTGEEKVQEGNILVLPGVQPRYEDLVRAVDVVVTKPGYGIVADALAHQVPMLYTDRGDFPEYGFLVQALSDLANAEYIPQDELLSGNIGPHLHSLLARQAAWPRVSLAGANVASEGILALL
jgi:L-arabinokinase